MPKQSNLLLMRDNQLTTFIESMIDGFAAFDNQWRYTYVNRVAEAIIQKKREEVLGKIVWEVFPEAIGTTLWKKYHEAVETQSMVEFEEYYPPLRIWFLVRAYPSKEGLNTFFQDISKYKFAEEELRLSEERLRVALKDSSINVYQQDTDLRYTWVYNPISALAPEEIIGKTDADFIIPDEARQLTNIKRRVLQSGQGVRKEVATTDNTGLRFVDLTVEPVRDSKGVIVGVTGAAIDISKRKELEQRKDELIGMASHELKTPITTLKGLIQLLERRLERAGLAEPIDTLRNIETHINKLIKLVNDLLDVSKIQAGRLEYAQDTIDIDALVQDIAETMQQTNSTHTIIIHGASHVHVTGDSDRLGQVFTNLISNAIKYSPGAKTVDIFYAEAGDTVTVSVQDYGIGIPKRHQNKIFERFYRVSDLHDRTFPGLGMGLYIAYDIVKRHGGEIVVTSEEGKGSTFSVSLPLKR